MKTQNFLLCAMTAVLLLGAGTVGAPISTSDAQNRIRPGVGRHASRLVLDNDTTTELFPVQPGSSVPACYPDRGTLVISNTNSGTGETSCFVSLAVTAVTLGAQSGEATAVLMTDAATGAPDGAGNVMTIAPNGEWHQTIDVTSQRTNFGARTGLCSDYIALASAVNGFAKLRPACRVGTDSDCTAAGAPAGTTCVAPSTLATTVGISEQALWDESCVFVGCRAVSNNTRATAHFSL